MPVILNSAQPFQQPRDAIDWSLVQRVLVIKLRHHGDVLLTTPVFTVLKQQQPSLEIDALVYSETQPMLFDNPHLSVIHGIDKGWKKLPLLAYLRQELKLFKVLRERRYDLILHLTENKRGLWLTRLLRPRWAATYQGRHITALWRTSFTHLVPQPLGAAGARRHVVEKHLDVLRRLGLHVSAPAQSARLQIVAGERAAAAVKALLASKRFAEKSFIHLHPTARWFFKCWSIENNARLLDSLLERGEQVVLTAAPVPQEAAMITAILERLVTPAQILTERLLNLSGQLSLREMAALTASAQAFIGVDSAPMHIAAATQTPAVVLFGPSGELEWGPWCSPHRILTSQAHACRPCGIDGCGGGKVSECLASLAPARVLQALDDLLCSS